ncbi:MAG: hypothetical protein H7039_20260 [Bryobacteraceae bacterium]|nr:hypothetical protein [Bryobacteraceae bacterium]
MRKFALLGALLAGTFTAQAATIIGSLSIVSLSTTINGTNLQDSTTFSQSIRLVGDSFGDYSFIPLGTTVSDAVIDVNNLSAYSFTIGEGGSIGTFTAAFGTQLTDLPNFDDFYFEGVFTPGAGFTAGFDPSPTSVRISLNQSGEAISSASTLASPPTGLVPEPTTVATGLAGLALVGMMRLRRRRS